MVSFLIWVGGGEVNEYVLTSEYVCVCVLRNREDVFCSISGSLQQPHLRGKSAKHVCSGASFEKPPSQNDLSDEVCH